MRNKIISLVFVLCFLVVLFPINASASGNFQYKISCTTTTPTIGSEFEVVISLTNYAEIEDEIRGLQIDVTNIDSDVFEFVSDSTMITDSSAASNKISKSTSNGYIRLFYLKLSGTMEKSVTDVMKFRLKIKDDLTDDGAISLPITFKIGTAISGDNFTLTDSLTINYQKEVISVDISWGSMEFVYDTGNWDRDRHKWVDGSWNPTEENGNLITLANMGNVPVQMLLSYEPKDSYEAIGAAFVDDSDSLVDVPIVFLPEGSEQKYRLQLSGETETRWVDEFATIGTVTVTIIV